MPALLVLLAVAIALIVTQGNRIRLLEGMVADLEMKTTLPVGLELRQVKVRDVSGKDFQIDFTSKHTKPMLIYVLRPSCSICRGNASSIGMLARSLGKQYDVIGLSLERQGLEDLIARENIPFPVYTDVPRDVVRAYGLGGTPQTIVVSVDGKILKSWMGGYDGALQTAIEQFFSVQLPDFQGVS